MLFSPAGFVCVRSAHVTNSGNGRMMSTAGLELPYPRVSQARFGTKPLGGESNVMFVKH